MTTVLAITGVIAAILLFAAGPIVATHQARACGDGWGDGCFTYGGLGHVHLRWLWVQASGSRLWRLVGSTNKRSKSKRSRNGRFIKPIYFYLYRL